MAHRRSHALRRRYGHATLADVGSLAVSGKKIAQDNPTLLAAALGAASGAGLALAGLDIGPSALAGAVAGVVVEQLTKK